MEAVYDDVPQPVGFLQFAPVQPARGPMFGSASRAGHPETAIPVVEENDRCRFVGMS